MGKRLTEDQRDARKWEAARTYLLAFIAYQDLLQEFGTLHTATGDAWHWLMIARKLYVKESKR